MLSKSKFWKLPGLSGLELQKATYKNFSFTPHFHEEYAIGVLLKGSQKKFYKGSTQIISEGSICVINPGEVHHACSIDKNGWTYRMLYLESCVMKLITHQIFGKEDCYPLFPKLIINDKKLFNMILKLHYILEQKCESRLERESEFINVMGYLILNYASVKSKNYHLKTSSKHIKITREYLDENYDKEVSLEKLSKIAELSQFYLLRLFKKEVGVTPHIYLTQQRIKKAKQFLTSGDSLSDVAYKTGFVDQSHFSNRFRCIVGTTPGQYILNS